MFKMHVVSDLNLGFNESSQEDEQLPDVDLVVIVGNCGMLKRSALYAETVARKYPNIQFFWGWGEKERYFTTVEKFDGELEQAINFRIKNTDFPKNLHWSFNNNILINLQNGQTIDLFYAYGFPYILSHEGDWENTNWFRNYIVHIEHDSTNFIYKPKETSSVRHGGVPIFATKDWINSNYEEVLNKLRSWENNINTFKLLVTHINPYNDNRLEGQKFWPYKIHLKDMAWVTSNSKVNNVNFLGAKLISNPGRGLVNRTKIFTIDC